MPTINIAELEEYQNPIGQAPLKGVFNGGCVDRGEGSSSRRMGHAHIDKNGENPGWICIRSMKRIYNPRTGKLDDTLLHELAHILTGQGHTLTWGRKFKELAHKFGVPYRITRNYAWKSKLI